MRPAPTSTVKRCVLAMSMRFAYGPIPAAVESPCAGAGEAAVTDISTAPIALQEFRLIQ